MCHARLHGTTTSLRLEVESQVRRECIVLLYNPEDNGFILVVPKSEPVQKYLTLVRQQFQLRCTHVSSPWSRHRRPWLDFERAATIGTGITSGDISLW